MEVAKILELRAKGYTWNQIDMELLDVDQWVIDKKGKIFSQAWKLMVKLGHVVMKKRAKVVAPPVSFEVEFAM